MGDVIRKGIREMEESNREKEKQNGNGSGDHEHTTAV
jgi:Arc/MetJ-type ribon-helix-helix transcriptional regulator